MTSHDVVAWARRCLEERSIGHAGTLDPLATGLLVLMVGRATRLASLLTGKDKTYDAVVRLGFATETDDADGAPLQSATGILPTEEQVRTAVATFQGTFAQVPPAHSAKQVGGTRAYVAARRATPLVLAPVDVTVHLIEWQGFADGFLRVRVTAKAGFYVRALARDVGRALGCGGHLSSLRRIRSGAFTIEQALPIAAADPMGVALGDRLIPPSEALADLPAACVNERGFARVMHGNSLGPEHFDVAPHWSVTDEVTGPVKVLSVDGRLLALAELRGGVLHPIAVLG